MTRLALALVLLAGCAHTQDVAGYRVHCEPDFRDPIRDDSGRVVRAHVSCTRRTVVYRCSDDEALLHELEHVIHCCERREDCRQD